MTPQSPNRIERSIALIGYRGSGKTTVGRALAAQLGVPFVDTDELVVEAAGKPISKVFADEGEARFRELERKAIGELKAIPPSVISVGGGAVVNPDNVAALRSVATVIWLTAPPDVLADRIQSDIQSVETRPALTDQDPHDEVVRILRQRTPIYEQAANHTMHTEDRIPGDIAASIMALVRS